MPKLKAVSPDDAHDELELSLHHIKMVSEMLLVARHESDNDHHIAYLIEMLPKHIDDAQSAFAVLPSPAAHSETAKAA